MNPRKNSARGKLKLRTAALLVCVAVPLLPSFAFAQGAFFPKRVLVLYWYNKDFPFNDAFDRSFQEALRSAPAGTVEYYPEYLETDRFPGENQSRLLRDYLRKKYAGRAIDVLVASGYVTLEFLRKYRDDLFPHTPIVFLLTTRPTTEQLAAGPGLTGIITLNTYRETLDLALRLHPRTEQVFVISGTLERDKKLETMAREDLQGYEGRVRINYLTDLPPDQLIAKTKSLPARSIVLYVWQQAQTEQGKVLEFVDVLDLISRSAPVPVYGLASWHVGSGIVGGYVNSPEASATRIAEIALRIANGERAQDIPVENDPAVSMFDWRQLRRWRISEDTLPPGSIVRFKQLTFWEQYKWHIVGVLALCAFQALLIVALLVQRARRRSVEEALHENQENLERTTDFSLVMTAHVGLDSRWLRVPPTLCELLGYTEQELLARYSKEVTHPDDFEEDWNQCQRLIRGEIKSFDLEKRYIRKDGQIIWGYLNRSLVSDAKGRPVYFLTYIKDVTGRKLAEEALRRGEAALRESHARIEDLAGRLIIAQEEERKHLARELHDDLNQQLAALAIGLGKLDRQLVGADEGVRNQISKLEDRVARLSERIRELSHELHSSTLEHVGLAEALRLYCLEFAVQEGIAVNLEIQDDLVALSDDAALCLYRVAQESLQNVARHSGAKRAEVTLARAGNLLELRVSDRGRGFDQKQAGRQTGLGLVSIEERVKFLHGRLEVTSQPGSGTELAVHLPLIGSFDSVVNHEKSKSVAG